jgi:drug/metabolite transporter (DMT)-like permease
MTLPIQSAASGRATLAGIGLMLAGVFVFSLNDALVKWLVGTYSVGELLLSRSLVGLALLLPFIGRSGLRAFAAAPRPGLQIVRVALGTAEVALFFWAVRYLPLADTLTFYLAGPIYVTALSVPLLGERVGWRRWSAVLVGFTGVLVALVPSPERLSLPALIALSGSGIFALLMIATRALRATPNTVLVGGQILGTLALGLVATPLSWMTPSVPDAALLVLTGVNSIVALACVNRSLTLAPASVVVPYQYTMIVWGALFGYLVFGDVPRANVFAGAENREPLFREMLQASLLAGALTDARRRRRSGHGGRGHCDALLLLVPIRLGFFLFLVAAHLTFCHGDHPPVLSV